MGFGALGVVIAIIEPIVRPAALGSAVFLGDGWGREGREWKGSTSNAAGSRISSIGRDPMK